MDSDREQTDQSTRVEEMEEDPNCLRFFLMGKTGSGKSATGNTILGEDKFWTEASFKSITTDVEMRETAYGGKVVKVMDSPGLFDTERSEADVAALLVKAVATLHPGPHVLLFVVRFGRYTAEDHAVYVRLKALLDDHIKKHTIIVFTHADDLNATQAESIQEVISNGPENLKQLMADCNNRYVLFNNVANDKQSQVADLMDKVLQLKNDNQHQPYQCPRYAYVAEKIEEETRKRLEEVEKKELERSQHYRRLEEELRQKDQELESRKRELDRRAEELERQEQEEVKKLLERIKVLEQQLESHSRQTTQERGSEPQQPDAEPDPRVAVFEKQVAELRDQLQNLQRELTNERVKVENKQNVEVNITAEKNRLEQELTELKEKQTQREEEKNDLEQKLQDLKDNNSQDYEEKKRLREELEELKQKQEKYDKVHANLTQQQELIEQLRRSLQEKVDKQTEEERVREEKLEAARKQIQQLEMEKAQQQQSMSNQSKKSGVCAIL